LEIRRALAGGTNSEMNVPASRWAFSRWAFAARGAEISLTVRELVDGFVTGGADAR
jgi:hypothetical protein